MPEVTVQLPDIQQIVHIGPLETKEDRRAAYLRMRANAEATGIPLDHWYRKIQNYITALDDAEDLISTALLGGKYIAPKLLLRAAPVVGPVLLVKDALDIALMVLSLTQPASVIMHGSLKTAKRRLGETTKAGYGSNRWSAKKVSDYLERKLHLGDILEALQASDTLFDVGLRLGPIIGFVDDTLLSMGRTAIQEGRSFIKQQ